MGIADNTSDWREAKGAKHSKGRGKGARKLTGWREDSGEKNVGEYSGLCGLNWGQRNSLALWRGGRETLNGWHLP